MYRERAVVCQCLLDVTDQPNLLTSITQSGMGGGDSGCGSGLLGETSNK